MCRHVCGPPFVHNMERAATKIIHNLRNKFIRLARRATRVACECVRERTAGATCFHCRKNVLAQIYGTLLRSRKIYKPNVGRTHAPRQQHSHHRPKIPSSARRYRKNTRAHIRKRRLSVCDESPLPSRVSFPWDCIAKMPPPIRPPIPHTSYVWSPR